MIPEERCSCNARLKYKCCKESALGGGKMCVKEDKFEILKDRLQKAEGTLNYLRQLRPLVDSGNGYSTAISFEQMSDYAVKWMEQGADVVMCIEDLKEGAVPIPLGLVKRVQVIRKKAEDNIALETAKQMFPEYEITSAEFVDDVLRIEARLPGSIQYVSVTGELE